MKEINHCSLIGLSSRLCRLIRSCQLYANSGYTFVRHCPDYRQFPRSYKMRRSMPNVKPRWPDWRPLGSGTPEPGNNAINVL